MRRALKVAAFTLLCLLVPVRADAAGPYTIGAANTAADSWYGSGAFAVVTEQTFTVDCGTAMGSVTYDDSPLDGDSNLQVRAFRTDGDFLAPAPDATWDGAVDTDRTYQVPPSAGGAPSGEYVFVVMSWAPADHAGQSVDVEAVAAGMMISCGEPPAPSETCIAADNDIAAGTSPGCAVVVTTEKGLTIFLAMGAGLLVLLQAIQTVNSFGNRS